MIRFVIGLLLIAAAIAAAAIGIPLGDRQVLVEDPATGRSRVVTTKRTSRGLAAIPAIIGLLLAIWPAVHIVRATEVAVPVRTGRAGDPVDNGLQVTAPWTKLVRFGTQVQSRDLDITVTGSDGGTMLAATTVRYRVTIGDQVEGAACSVKDLFKRVRSETALEKLVVDRETDAQLRAAFLTAPAFKAYTVEQPAIVQAAATSLAAALKAQCVILDRLLITKLTPSDRVQASIDAAIASEQQVNTARQQAEAARQTAQGQADAAVTAAKGQADATITAAKAEQDAAAARAAANRTLAESLTPAVLQAQMIEALRTGQNKVIVTDGAPPQILVDGNTATSTAAKK